MKILLKLLFYDIPKDIWSDGKWDKEDHIELYTVNFYKVHETYTYYSKLSHAMAIVILNVLSLFSWEIGISRIVVLWGMLRSKKEKKT